MTLKYAGVQVQAETLEAERAIAEAVGASVHTEVQKVELTPPAVPADMKVWPESVRGVPNVALRSALFAGIKAGDERMHLAARHIHSQADIKITYTGGQLDQGDLDVWETVLHLSRDQNMAGCVTNSYQMLKALGQTDTGVNRERLGQRLSRLNATALKISVQMQGKTFSYEGSLIDDVTDVEHEDGGRARDYRITLNPKLLVLFGSDQYTLIDWKVRRELTKHPLAQWVHGYYSSHAAPLPVSVELLHRMSGSGASTVAKFGQTLRKALDAVEAACEKHGQPFAYEVKKGLLTVVKTPSAAQARHLARAASKAAKEKVAQGATALGKKPAAKPARGKAG
ncbi:plasmid replication initiator TrfA [Geopseudomonas aromaticivorans]